MSEFVEAVFFEECADLHGTCVGFNLPFDLSRIAINHGTAKSWEAWRKFQHGFSLQLSQSEYRPRVRIKHLSHRAAFIEFATPKQGIYAANNPEGGHSENRPLGFFLDVKTLAGVLLSESHSLETLTEALDTPTKKREADKHGEALTPDYIDYARKDVQATWECYRRLTKRLAAHRLPNAPAHSLISEASLGKAYLDAMGIRPWMEVQPDYPPELIGQILSAYFGGRSEVHIRREIRQTYYCDFLSMYPTVNTLMGLWRFLTADGIDTRDATVQTRRRLQSWTPEHLLEQANWRDLSVLVQVLPNDDVLPVRAVYGDAQPRHEANKIANTAVNRLTCEAPLWFTLADCLASKFLSGKPPEIRQAIAFSPRRQQRGLRKVAVAGQSDLGVDPRKQDFFKALIDVRRTVVASMAGADEKARDELERKQLALKILANSTSYGIFIETLVSDFDRPETIRRYGFDGSAANILSKVEETPGRCFHPLLATLITGAARLMLALAEWKAADEGLDWVFCDTDSIALAKPDDMAGDEFLKRAKRVCAWFEPLNPYDPLPGDGPGSILRAEAENYRADSGAKTKKLEPLFAYAISAKRYALFNKDPEAGIILRKASAHGLGHLLPPFQAPDEWQSSCDVAYWQEHLWLRILELASEGADDLRLAADDRFDAPAATQYSATSPNLLRWFGAYNR